jgi:hypothetical protein
MALTPTPTPITREEVQGILDKFKGKASDIRQFLIDGLSETRANEVINTQGRDAQRPQRSMIDLIMDDLSSYDYRVDDAE